MDREILKGSIDILLLSLILQKDMYGYEISKKIKEMSCDFYEMGEGTLYPALRRLVDKNFLEYYWGNCGSGARRKYYKITKLGIKELKSKLISWYEINNLINECVKGGNING